MKSRSESLIRLKKFQVDEKRRQVAQIEMMVADFERMASELDQQIEIEQQKTGISDVAHFAYSTFANGGKLAKPYAVLELYSSKGDLVYSREKDEPEAPQVVTRKVAEMMNQMMQAVVQEGTGRRAILDFTYSAGKTGTSTSYRDAWFVGFTGALVTGVWVGYDDFRPMHFNGSGVTGGRCEGGSPQAPSARAARPIIHPDRCMVLIARLRPQALLWCRPARRRP